MGIKLSSSPDFEWQRIGYHPGCAVKTTMNKRWRCGSVRAVLVRAVLLRGRDRGDGLTPPAAASQLLWAPAVGCQEGARARSVQREAGGQGVARGRWW